METSAPTLGSIFGNSTPTATPNAPVSSPNSSSLDTIFNSSPSPSNGGGSPMVSGGSKPALDNIFNPKPGTTGTGAGGLSGFVKSMSDEFGGGDQSVGRKLIDNTNQATEEMNGPMGVKQFLAPTKAVFRGLGDIAGAVFHPVGAAIDALTGGALTKMQEDMQKGEADTTTGVGKLVDTISNIPIVQKFAMADPQAGEDFNRLLNLIMLGTTNADAKASPDTTPADLAQRIKTQATSIPPQIDSILNKIISSPGDLAENVKNTVKDKIFGNQQEQIPQMTKEWEQPVKNNAKAGAILDKTPETPRFLAEHGLDPQAHVEEGKYNTGDSAQALRDTAGKMSTDALRPSLQRADFETPKTPVEDIVSKTISDIKNGKGTTPGDAESMIAKAKAEGEALKAKYPDGMSLTDMHDEKISYNSNRYSPLGAKSDANAANVDRSFGRTLQSTVEAKAPAEVPVGQFNQYLQKYYKAADYLDSLDGKKAVTTTGQKIVRGAAKMTGAVVGSAFGLPASFAGYSLGGALEQAVEKMPNPVRTEFISNLRMTNPEAYNKVINYLGESKAREFTQLKLPEPTPLGTDKNPIITAPPTTYEKAAEKINRQPVDQKLLEGEGKNPIQVSGKIEDQFDSTNKVLPKTNITVDENMDYNRKKFDSFIDKIKGDTIPATHETSLEDAKNILKSGANEDDIFASLGYRDSQHFGMGDNSVRILFDIPKNEVTFSPKYQAQLGQKYMLGLDTMDHASTPFTGNEGHISTPFNKNWITDILDSKGKSIFDKLKK